METLGHFGIIVGAVLVVAGIYWLINHFGQKNESEDLKAAARFAEACEESKAEVAEATVKIELAQEPKVEAVKKATPKKKVAKKPAKIKANKVEVETFELQPVAPKKPRKPREKKPE